MTKLTFPTMAEQAVAEFREPGKTKSLATIAKRMGADVKKTFEGVTTYTFDDDTSVTVTGRGRAHKIETHWP